MTEQKPFRGKSYRHNVNIAKAIAGANQEENNLYSFFFLATVEGLGYKLKYWANIIHHFIFVFFSFFFDHSFFRKDEFTVLIINLVLKILLTQVY